ncbi:amidohydrolase [Pseudoalteromonas xiamenensis]|uniref:Amidohydrolase n=1 Tax=Pseudoalteromonas xiamenensis TaxID=882626 RepID=A0A975DID3_9GAMM|nr:amidohydrolase [Pseudoalteromonas xiamenensis]QTH72418.1 amidohydrolase [Pseudoalteromonas xiamenensis]
MKKWLIAGLSLICTSALANTTLIHNISGYTPTLKGATQSFSVLVVRDGKVVATGNDDMLKQFPEATRYDGHGKTLLPGLIDAHGHIIGLGNNLVELDLRGMTSIKQIGEKLKAYSDHFDGEWIVGRGWDQTLWSSQQFGSAADLDKYVGNRPVMLTRVDGHAIWVNSKAMQMAGIDEKTKAPEGGEIIYAGNHQPSGVFVDKAEELVRKHVPAASEHDVKRALNKASEHLLSLGITSAHDAGIDYTTWQVYQEQAKNKAIPIRIYAMLSASDPKLETMLKAGIIKDPNDHLSVRSVKIYADGALGSRGAALIDSYKDRPGHHGLMLETYDKLRELMRLSFKHGFSANTHAIGDKANRVVLDAYEAEFKKTGGKLLRNRIEHAQIVTPEDIPRFKSLDIIPSMQPVHATSDMHMAEKRLTDNQLAGGYAWQTFLKQGSKIAAGSDFPVELAEPFHGLFSAVTRQDPHGQPEQGWRAEEALSRDQALRAFTLDAAYAAFQEHKLGSLEKGKWADFILIDKDYFNVPALEIRDIQVDETWVAGQLVYKRMVQKDDK